MPLNDPQIRNVKPGAKPRKLADGRGMYLLVKPNGARYWRLKYRFGGREKTFAIGVYPEVSLKLARERREDALKLLYEGVDPSEDRQERKREARDGVGVSVRREGSIVRKGDRKWRVSIYLGTRPESGKRIYHSKTIHGTKADADYYLREKLTMHRIGILETVRLASPSSLRAARANRELWNLGAISAAEAIEHDEARQAWANSERVATLRSALVAARRGPHVGHIYIIQGRRGGAIKIGFSSDIEKRLKGLQTASPDPLRVVARKRSPAAAFDKSIHEVLPPNARASGEWFNPSAEVVQVLRELGFGTSGIVADR